MRPAPRGSSSSIPLPELPRLSISLTQAQEWMEPLLQAHPSGHRQHTETIVLIMAIDCPISPANGDDTRQRWTICWGSLLCSGPSPHSRLCHPSHPSQGLAQCRECSKKWSCTLQMNQGSILLKQSLLPVPSCLAGVALPAESTPEQGLPYQGSTMCHSQAPTPYTPS